MKRYKSYFNEDIIIPLEKGDTFLWGKWKNKSAVFDHIEQDEKGQDIIITDTGKKIPLLKIRLSQERFTESLRLSDLMKHQGTSDFTKDWVEIRRKILGTGEKIIKLKSMKVNKKSDYITFIFKSKPTYDTIVKAVDFPNKDKEINVKDYTQQIRILDFFKWAETKPGYKKEKLTRKEIKEILNVADIQLSCNCKSFQFQGMNHILSTFDAAIFPEPRPPKVWDKWHNNDNFTCKHLDGLLTQALNIYLNNMASMVNSYLKK